MKMGMSAKVIILFLIAGIVPFAVTGIMSKKMSATSLKEQAFSQLVSVRETKKKQIEDYFSNIRKQIQTFSEDRMIVDAMKEFKAAFKEFIFENNITDLKLEEYREALKDYYTHVFVEEYKRLNNGLVPDIDKYFDRLDDDSIVLQYF